MDTGEDVTNASHPQVAVVDGRVAVVWDESRPAGPRHQACGSLVQRGIEPGVGCWRPDFVPAVTFSEPGRRVIRRSPHRERPRWRVDHEHSRRLRDPRSTTRRRAQKLNGRVRPPAPSRCILCECSTFPRGSHRCLGGAGRVHRATRWPGPASGRRLPGRSCR
jgi:hypothetical protein